jgi:hypothetical protein
VGREHAAGAVCRTGGAAVVVIALRAMLDGVREESVPQGSLLGAAPSAMWLPPRLRVRPSGDGFVLAPPGLHRLVGDRFTDVLEAGRVDDALPDGDGAWILEGRSLRHVPPGDGPEGPWERLLGDASKSYAVARRPKTVVAQLPGGAARELGPGGLDPVMDSTGRIAWVDAERHWNVLGEGRVPLAPGAEGVPIGLDDAGRGYLARATGITVIEPDGSLAWSFGADGIVLGPDGGVLTSHDLEFSPPDAGRTVAWRLIAADGDALLLWGGEGARGPGVLARVDRSGAVLQLDDPAPEDARQRGWWPAAARDWQVDGAGRVHFTLAGPGGVAVVTLQG